MIALGEALGPRLCGAEVLAHLARERADGQLIWTPGGPSTRIWFKAGRPERVGTPTEGETADKTKVVASVRSFAGAIHGRLGWEALDREFPTSLGVDTLGEGLLGLVRQMVLADLTAVTAQRADDFLEPTGAFVKVAPVVAKLVGLGFESPEAGGTLRQALRQAGSSEAAQRGYLALMVLGAIRATPATSPGLVEPQRMTPKPGVTSTTANAATAPHVQTAPTKLKVPADPKARALVAEIQLALDRLDGMTFYELLGVAVDANAEAVREAYFAVARRWHSDRFSGQDLDADAVHAAEDIFRRAGEAQRVLSDPKERQNYDFLLDRRAKGLPTEVGVILEAEALFHKAQVLIRRGQAAAAEPLLRKATEMNRGEPEFFAYLGFAIYSAKGHDGLAEAKAALQHASDAAPKLDVVDEFLGRIARVEGRLSEAQRHLRSALEKNPKNREAERELRLINMRASKSEDDEGSGLGALLSGFLKKK